MFNMCAPYYTGRPFATQTPHACNQPSNTRLTLIPCQFHCLSSLDGADHLRLHNVEKLNFSCPGVDSPAGGSTSARGNGSTAGDVGVVGPQCRLRFPVPNVMMKKSTVCSLQDEGNMLNQLWPVKCNARGDRSPVSAIHMVPPSDRSEHHVA